VNYVTSRQHTYLILYDDSLQFVIVSIKPDAGMR